MWGHRLLSLWQLFLFMVFMILGTLVRELWAPGVLVMLRAATVQQMI